ncbi:hypothetical protein HZI73_00035 [Vallitalea pronyensis]|uniref:Fibronectin type-III domain-containing protein n=1 Tax=Vallitalea pronyensis TaxID=1348613 RepID=A0A8J8MFT2_9FIRM|nr:fibronectin type III domain-containing protein [Vallitalea pronyensis]QUI20794.1 hypothetical protein HZI73_00035 [Vallitalea pronyensis]
MRKCGKIFSLVILVALMLVNSLTALAAEGELGTWESKASMPTGRDNFGIAEVGQKIYTIGGRVSSTYSSSVVEEYDPVTNSWTSKASMSEGRYAPEVVALNGKIYVLGGQGANKDLLASVEEYDPITNTWTYKASMSTPRFAFGSAVVNGKIYAIAGNDGSVEEYDPVTDTWSYKTNIPSPRGELGVAVANNKIYVIGGNSAKGNVVEEYDPQTDSWSTKANMPTARFGVRAIEANGMIYAIGGHDGKIYSDVVEKYNPQTDVWTTEAKMPTPRYGLGLEVVDKTIYAIGGKYPEISDYMRTNEAFTPYTEPINVVTPTNLTATPSDNSITLNWDAVTDADSYTILRSTISGAINTVIATDITGTTYTDTNVTPGVTYYYVVRAVKNNVESTDSNIASAIIEISNNKALLLIKLLDENDKEYDLTMNDVDTFMNWYFDRGAGQGPAYYVFAKNYNVGPYISRKDYISYDKIICIEVNEYKE